MARTRNGQAVELLDGEPLVRGAEGRPVPALLPAEVPRSFSPLQLDLAEADDWAYYTTSMAAQASTLTVTISLTSSDLSGKSSAAAMLNGTAPAPAAVSVFAAIGTDFILSPVAPGYQYAIPTLTIVGQEVAVTLSRSDAAFAAGCPMTPGTPAQWANVSGVWTQVAPATAPAPTACTVQILVVSAYPSTFVVTATTLSRELLNGVATTGMVPPNTPLLFTFNAGGSSTHVVLSLESLAGDALAYVSSSVQAPNASTAEHTMGGLGASSLTLNPTADGCASSSGGSSASVSSCYYFISVVSASPGASAVFRLQATTSQVIRLTPGLPTSAIAGPAAFVYFEVNVPAGSNAGLSFIAQVGEG